MACLADQLGADHAEFLNLMMHLSAMGVIPSGMVGGDMGMPNYYFDGEEDEVRSVARNSNSHLGTQHCHSICSTQSSSQQALRTKPPQTTTP